MSSRLRLSAPSGSSTFSRSLRRVQGTARSAPLQRRPTASTPASRPPRSRARARCRSSSRTRPTRVTRTASQVGVGLQQRPDRRLDGPEPAVHLHRRRLRREVHGQPQDDGRHATARAPRRRRTTSSSTRSRSRAPRPSAGSTVPAGVPGPIQMPAYSRTYSLSSQVRGWWAQAPVTFVDQWLQRPQRAERHDQSVWFFTTPNTTRPRATRRHGCGHQVPRHRPGRHDADARPLRS
jgi:hypothetical protein